MRRGTKYKIFLIDDILKLFFTHVNVEISVISYREAFTQKLACNELFTHVTSIKDTVLITQLFYLTNSSINLLKRLITIRKQKN